MAGKAYYSIVHGHRIYYRVYGSGSPMILLHGFGRSGSTWQHILPYLQNYQLVVVDIPGYGHSRFIGQWRFREVTLLLETWLHKLKIQPVTLIGHSLGGGIAIHLAALTPERIQRLILVNAVGMPLQIDLPTLLYRSLLSSLQNVKKNNRVDFIIDITRSKPHFLWKSLLEVINIDLRAELAGITIPTLIIWGERDLLIPLSDGHALRDSLSHAFFASLPDSGHRPHFTEPEKFSRLVVEFSNSN